MQPSKLKYVLGKAPHTPSGWGGGGGVAPFLTNPDLALRAKMAPPPFLVPAISGVVLAISNLNKNPEFKRQIKESEGKLLFKE